jgi:hypothetical protein
LNECALSPWRRRPDYTKSRAQMFTATVTRFMEAGYRNTITDCFGKAALDGFWRCAGEPVHSSGSRFSVSVKRF